MQNYVAKLEMQRVSTLVLYSNSIKTPQKTWCGSDDTETQV